MPLLKGMLVSLSLLVSIAATTQPATRIAVVDDFGQRVSVRAWAGRPYRVSVRIKVDTTQSGGAAAWLLASVQRISKKSGNFAAVPHKAVANTWQTYTATGKLDRDADSLTIVAGYHLNGRFEFDDFRLEAQQRTGQWQQVPLTNGSFDDPAPLLATGTPVGWRNFGPPVQGFSRQLTTDSTGNR
ncbi:hypothetical protein [Hymenobacter weizhouensis]|uniref:hypothetical protein n=1 Tax=Hymenobacter sp. YIM 151500-1 TaxID=2987689 RepID=UPI0022271769|nr:hypothetical protein [Hymenobacter sp. YIM 151500-1]UYZ62761.1 hypothetical protein OIS53_17405 [Hymenobacter sp. YIM 151500-1]